MYIVSVGNRKGNSVKDRKCNVFTAFIASRPESSKMGPVPFFENSIILFVLTQMRQNGD